MADLSTHSSNHCTDQADIWHKDGYYDKGVR